MNIGLIEGPKDMNKNHTLTYLIVSCLLIAVESQAQPEVKDGFFNSSGINIHYIEAGKGEAVILHHGFTGDSQSWVRSGVFDSLASDYRVIAIDARAHGESDKPHSIESYGIEMSNDIVRLMDHLGVDKAHIIGYSMGAWLVGPTVVNHEHRFLSAVFGGAAPDWEWTAEIDAKNRSRAQAMMENPPQRVVDLELDNLALGLAMLASSEFVVSKEGLESLNIPIMAIVGSEDEGIEYLENFRRLRPDMNYVVMDGVAHVEGIRAAQFIESVTQFLDSLQSK